MSWKWSRSSCRADVALQEGTTDYTAASNLRIQKRMMREVDQPSGLWETRPRPQRQRPCKGEQDGRRRSSVPEGDADPARGAGSGIRGRLHGALARIHDVL